MFNDDGNKLFKPDNGLKYGLWYGDIYLKVALILLWKVSWINYLCGKEVGK